MTKTVLWKPGWKPIHVQRKIKTNFKKVNDLTKLWLCAQIKLISNPSSWVGRDSQGPHPTRGAMGSCWLLVEGGHFSLGCGLLYGQHLIRCWGREKNTGHEVGRGTLAGEGDPERVGRRKWEMSMIIVYTYEILNG